MTLQFFQCGGSCPGGGEHVWDGPEQTFTSICASCEGVPLDPPCSRCKGQPEYISGSAATCSKCGLDAMSHTLMSSEEDFEWPSTRLERAGATESVHILDAGLSLCSMSKRYGVPGDWPEGNTWVRLEEKDRATCKACLYRASKT